MITDHEVLESLYSIAQSAETVATTTKTTYQQQQQQQRDLQSYIIIQMLKPCQQKQQHLAWIIKSFWHYQYQQLSKNIISLFTSCRGILSVHLLGSYSRHEKLLKYIIIRMLSQQDLCSFTSYFWNLEIVSIDRMSLECGDGFIELYKYVCNQLHMECSLFYMSLMIFLGCKHLYVFPVKFQNIFIT